MTRREWDESDDDDLGDVYPPAPIPQHERVWRHPSEVAGAARHDHGPLPPSSPFGRGLAIVTGIVGVAFVIGMARLLISPEGPAVTDVSATTLSGTWAGFQPFSSDSTASAATTPPAMVATTVAMEPGPSTTAAVVTLAAQTTTTVLAVSAVRHAAPVGDGSMAVTTARQLDTGASVTVRLADGSSHQASVLKVDRDVGVALVRLDRPAPAASSPVGRLPVAGSPVHVITDGRTVEATVDDDDGVTLIVTADEQQIAEGAAITDADGDLVGLCTWEDHQLRALDLKGTPALLATPAPSDRGWLGVVGGNDDAVVVMRVQPSSPAQAAGVMAGDVITEIDGMSIASFADLRDIVSARSPGASVTLTVLRGSSTMMLTVTLAPQPTTTTTLPASTSTTAAPTTTVTSSPTTTLTDP